MCEHSNFVHVDSVILHFLSIGASFWLSWCILSPRVDYEKTVKGRKAIYGGYAIYDGKARPGYFTLGQKPASQSSDANDGV